MLAVNNAWASCVFSQIAAVSAFAQTLRRYTSLNHLAQAARAVLQNTSQINQMLSDLNRVDFANVQVRRACFVWMLSGVSFVETTYSSSMSPPKEKKPVLLPLYRCEASPLPLCCRAGAGLVGVPV